MQFPGLTSIPFHSSGPITASSKNLDPLHFIYPRIQKAYLIPVIEAIWVEGCICTKSPG